MVVSVSYVKLYVNYLGTLSKNEPSFDLATHLYRISGVDFTEIDGLNVLTVQSILSEVGLSPEAFGQGNVLHPGLDFVLKIVSPEVKLNRFEHARS